MKFKLRHDKNLVGIFSLFGITIFIGLIVLIAINNNVFKGKIFYYTKLKTASGLGHSQSIMFKGYEIGKIKDYKLSDSNEIIVRFYIYKEFKSKMKKYSVLSNDFNPISSKITKFELILPVESFQNKGLIEENSYVPGVMSKEGQEYLSMGIIKYETRGIAGVVNQMNMILDKIIQKQTPEKLSEVVKNLAEVLSTSKETIASYNSKEGGQGSKILISTLNDVSKSVLYVRQTLRELHRNRKDLSPLIISTTKTLDKAQDTLDGLNNNPLLKGGIPDREPASLEVELSD